MDVAAFRWVLVIIAILLVVAIYLYGLQQSRLRKRAAMETFTREEIDSAFTEDQQLREELDSLNEVLAENEAIDNLDEIQINPARDRETTPYALPDPAIYIPEWLTMKDRDRVVSHLLRHDNFRLITGEEASSAVNHTGMERNAEGFLEHRIEDSTAFQIASLSAPGHFSEIEQLDFSTLGFNCFIDLDNCEHPVQAYEAMLKKIDELVRLLNAKVYQSSQELLTISDVTNIRNRLS
jgi:FtsZ-interacting cell division protein ZipA